ncbi:type II toxin-antitoxin system RelE/ParE family toxin [Methanomassiliicoccaceae archaeon COG_1]|nr:type II toxin-antitoxin system RelE/ParE family toxin [Methanomassiliicoccaceae archaeon COG_1]
MSYTVEFSEQFVKQMSRLDRFTRTLISSWISKHLVNSDDPFSSGRALTGNMTGLWRYRVGDYRLICSIDRGRLVVFLLEVGHRSNVYD